MSANKILEEKLINFYRSSESYFSIMERTHDLSYYLSIIRVLREKSFHFKNKKILDVGSGTGSFLKILRHEFGDVFEGVGTDISPLGKKLSSKKGFKFIVADSQKLPIKDKSFDIVFSIDVLEHIFNPIKALNEMYRVTKDGGFILIRTRNYRSPLTTCQFSSATGLLRDLVGGRKKDLGKVKHLEPKFDAKGGDEDAVSAIFADQFLNFFKKSSGKILVFETWTKGGGWKILNLVPLIGYLGSMCLVLFRKNK